MSIEAMKQALEALEGYVDVVVSVNDPNDWRTVADGGKPAREAITSLRQAIAEAEKQDGYCQACDGDLCTAKRGCVALSNPPPQRQPLTDEQIIELANGQGWNVQVADLPANLLRMRVRDLGRAIEAAHGIKGEA